MMARPCSRCGAPHGRYFHLCLACDPAPQVVAPPTCVWPLRCYCPGHRGRARALEPPTDPHPYGYVMWHHLGLEHARGECPC